MKGLCVHAGGGLGDVLRVTLCGDVGYPWCESYWGMLEQWREETKRPIKLIVASHNPSAASLFKHVPWVDEIQVIPWRDDGTQINKECEDDYFEAFTLPLKKQIETEYKSRWKRPKIYLSEDEQKEADVIEDQGSFVLLYPFGGYGARIKAEQYIPLIEMFKKADFNVVIVGDSYKRDDGLEVIETFDYEADGVFNLVGRDSCRLTSYLATKASLYVGSIGCYIHPITALNIKLFALTCYEIWENNSVYGTSILANDSLWYLRHYTGMYKNFADIVCIYNDEELNNLWRIIVDRAMVSTPSKFFYWGSVEQKRSPVSFPF